MPFTRPSVTEITDRIVTDIEARLPEAGTLLRRSVLKVLARVFAGAVHLAYGNIAYESTQLSPLTADSDGLDRLATEYGKVRTASAYATGSGTATGTAGTVIPSGSSLRSGEGNVYTTNTDYTIAVDGSVTISFTAAEAGADSNDDGSITLTFVSPTAGVDTTVTVDTDGIGGGADEEADENLSERILSRLRLAPHGGAFADYTKWAKEVSGVTRAWSIPSYMGNGTVALAFVRDNDTSILPNAVQRAAMLDYVTEHDDPSTGETVGLPVTALPGFQVLTLTELEVNLTLTLYPNTVAVQNQVRLEVANLLLSDGGPGQTVYLSRISEAVSAALGEERHVLVSPTADISASYTQVHVLGTITFEAYS
jgi:uncharacterized phage protein gp47/JayE